MANNEHQFESDIEALMTGELGWSKARKLGAAAPSTGQTVSSTALRPEGAHRLSLA